MNKTATTTHTAHVLVIEDEPNIAELLRAYLARDGYRVSVETSGTGGLESWKARQPDLVLLDLRLPAMDGFEVLEQIRRQSQTPVIVLTAMTEDADRLRGLAIGADDYIAKPFNPAEVAARVRAVLRRSRIRPEQNLLRVGDLEVDSDAMEARISGKPLALTLTEFRLLRHLAEHPRRAYSRTQLIEACLPESAAVDRVVDSHIFNLRRKLESAGIKNYVTAVRGVGYRLLS